MNNEKVLTSNEDILADLEAAAGKWVLEKNKYTLGCLRDARAAVLTRMVSDDSSAPETTTNPNIVGEYEAWIAEVFGDTEFCTECVDKLAEYHRRKPQPPAQETSETFRESIDRVRRELRELKRPVPDETLDRNKPELSGKASAPLVEPGPDLTCEGFVPDPHSRFCDRCGYPQHEHKRAQNRKGD